MGWSLTPQNIAAIGLAPFTGGLSLTMAKDDEGYGIAENLTGEKSAREAERRQKEYQDETNKLSIELANTAHQREVADLKAASLNPVLSAGGTGSTTPALGTPIAQNTMPGGYLAQAGQIAQIANLAGTAQQARSQANLNNVNAQIQPAIAKADVASKFAQAGSAKATQDYVNYMKEIDGELKNAEKGLIEANTYRTKNLSKGEQTREWVRAITGGALNLAGTANGGMSFINSARQSPAYQTTRIGF